ncbi:helix-turn-helix domain-containing protein [Vibrio salinus]|uniref:helix-turn-helix domain-containing protein n=1 Tax=Vibrio salinus TaxID=2899784 RepID=UPI001E4CB29D|nr:helix-turn-helix domain-containing protein [Vibrio salinus]MCE0494979.1 helix-turn-helix domain-containing protein [Vibrio salinus]
MSHFYQPFQPTLTKTGLVKFGLSLKQIPASGKLKGIVYSYLQITAKKPTPYFVIPDGTQSIFISPVSAKLGGPHSKLFNVQLFQPGQYFGIRFYPGMMTNFINVALSEMTEQLINIQDLLPSAYHSLSEQIFQTSSFQKRVSICEEWLLKLIKPKSSEKFNHALSSIYQCRGDKRISSLSTDVGCSSRHLNRLFQMYTGLNTKQFMQTIRLQYASQQLFRLKNTSPDLALSLGYFDQSHLLNDFKKHFLISPYEFFERFRSDFYNSGNP